MKRHLSFPIIRTRIADAPPGSVFVAGDFTGVASGDAANEALLRLERRGDMRRVMRGVYEKPWHSEFLREAVAPDPDKIANALARKFGWTIAPCGDAALNLLGISTQVPAVWIYVSTGPYRDYALESAIIRFKHAANKEFISGSAESNRAIQALKALGEARIDESSVAAFRRVLDSAERKALLSDSQYTTGWIRDAIRRICRDPAP